MDHPGHQQSDARSAVTTGTGSARGAPRRVRVSVIIPAYNESQTIGRLLQHVLAVDLSAAGGELEVIVVDDGSSDGTAEILRTCGERVQVCRHTNNRGKGAAILTGLRVATGEIVLVQDADLEYEPADYPALLAPILAGRTQVVYGSRFLACRRPTGMPLSHFIGNKIITCVTNLLFGVRLTDEATGYKVLRADVLRSLGLRCEAFEFCPEVTAKLCKRRIPIHEVPIQYHGRTTAEGRKITWADGLRLMRALLHEWAAV